MTDDLKKRVHEAVLNTGFPLELRTAYYLKSVQYHVAHNVYFLDRDEQKGREIDLRALKNAFFTKGRTRYAVRHCLLLECKKSASRPWVIFTSPVVSYDQDVSDIQTAGAKDGMWLEPSFEIIRGFEARHPWFSIPNRGRSYFEPFANSPDSNQTIFKALVSVVKALIEVRNSGFGVGSRLRNLAFYYPLVVLEGQLFVARLESSGLVVEEAEAVPVSFYYRSAQYAEQERYTVLVVRETALEREIERLDAWLLEAAEYLKNHITRFSQRRKEKTKLAKRGAAAKTSSTRSTNKRSGTSH